MGVWGWFAWRRGEWGVWERVVVNERNVYVMSRGCWLMTCYFLLIT